MTQDTTAVPVSAKAGNGAVVRRLRVALLFIFGCLFLSVAAALVGAQAFSVINGGDLQIGMWEFATLALFVVPPLLLIWPHRGAGSSRGWRSWLVLGRVTTCGRTVTTSSSTSTVGIADEDSIE